MRWCEIAGGIQIFLSREEQSIIDRVSKGRKPQSSFDEREQEIARRMVSRGVLRCVRVNDELHYECDHQDLWRC